MNKIPKSKSKIFGKELILDLGDCNQRLIRSKKKILEYLEKVCKLIKVKKYGRPIIKRFGLSKNFTLGLSFLQLIECSLISGHVSEIWNKIFINIFSCKIFDEKIATNFTKEFFGAKKIKKRALIR